MRILVSTTLQTDVRDELEALGTMNLLRYGVKLQDVEVVLSARNISVINNFEVANSDFESLNIDMVVVIGAQSSNMGVTRILKFLEDHPEVPALFLGVEDPYGVYASLRGPESVIRGSPALFCTMAISNHVHDRVLSVYPVMNKDSDVVTVSLQNARGIKGIKYAGSAGALIREMLKYREVSTSDLVIFSAAKSCGRIPGYTDKIKWREWNEVIGQVKESLRAQERNKVKGI